MTRYGPLRGRAEALETALSVIRRGRTHSGVVLISGAAGIGKTALVSELCRHAVHANFRVARSKCDEIEQAWPGAPMIGLLRSGRDPLLTANEFEEVTRVTGEPLLLVDRIAGDLERLAAGHRLLIAIDDVQWADRVSRYALRALISRLDGLPVVWVLASRSEDVGLAVSAADVSGVEHIRLGPLAYGAIAEIARDRLGQSPSDRIQQMLAAAAGNAFLATQIIDGIAQGAGAGSEDGVPTEFTTVVRQRLSGLSTTARRLIEAAATAGRPLAISDSAELCDTTVGPVHDGAVAAVLTSGLVISNGAELSFSHDLVREAIYAMVGPDVRRRLHARIAHYFLETVGDPMLAAAHARAAATIGDLENADMMMVAAEALITMSAEDAADLALDAFHTLPIGQPRWLAMGERAVSVLSRAQRAADAIAVADLLLATVDDVDVVSRIETHTVKAMWLSGRFSELVDRADRIIVLAAGRRDLVARFRAVRALAQTRLLAADRAAEDADVAVTAAKAVNDPAALEFALQAAGEAANSQRRHHLALKQFRELRSVTGRPYLAEEIMELQLLDRYDAAQMLLDAAQAQSRANGKSVLPDLLFAQLKQEYNVGRLQDADHTAAALIELGQVVGTNLHVLEGMLLRTAIALLRGEPALAAQRLRPALDFTRDGDAKGHPGVILMQGWLTAEQGDWAGGSQILSPLVSTTRESRSYWAWWPCWMTVFFRIGMACGERDITRRSVEIAEEAAQRNPDVATLTGLALNQRGAAARDLALVAESAAILKHSPRPVFRAEGAETYGRLLLARGERDAALHQLDAAWDEYDRMGAWGYRTRVQHLMREAGARRAKWADGRHDAGPERSLSQAERRVAYLIGQGHTNKSAAKALGVSVNTVGTHLRSVYAKLSVQSRVQLTNALRQNGELQ